MSTNPDWDGLTRAVEGVVKSMGDYNEAMRQDRLSLIELRKALWRTQGWRGRFHLFMYWLGWQHVPIVETWVPEGKTARQRRIVGWRWKRVDYA